MDRIPLTLLLSKWARLFIALQTLTVHTSFNQNYYNLMKNLWPSP